MEHLLVEIKKEASTGVLMRNMLMRYRVMKGRVVLSSCLHRAAAQGDYCMGRHVSGRLSALHLALLARLLQ